MTILALVSGLTGFILFLALAWESHREVEPVAESRTLLMAVGWVLPSLAAVATGWPWLMALALVLPGLVLLGLLLVMVPSRRPDGFPPLTYPSKVDERSVMFARAALEPDTERFDHHYRDYPEHAAPDRRFRAKPGLLSPQSLKAEPLSFAAAEAGFRAVAELANLTTGEPSPERVDLQPGQAVEFLKGWARKLGALDVGVTSLRPEHIYATKGRGDHWGEPITLDHRWALALSVEMDHRQMATAPEGPTVMESAQQYLASGAIAVQIAEGLRRLGWRAEAHIDANYKVICPFVARDAGLGEIGRMGLLMTPRHGPRVRLAVVTTDLPLTQDESGLDPTVLDFCSLCEKCADICPSDAIAAGPRLGADGSYSWTINQEACFTYWCSVGTDCGQCIRVCPYSHPDTLIHGLVRRGLRHSALFRRTALKLDDLLYGRRPESREPPGWLRS